MKFNSTPLVLAGALLVSLGATAQAQNSHRAKSTVQKAFGEKGKTERVSNVVSVPGTSQNFGSDLMGGWTHYSNSTYTYDSNARLTERIDVVPGLNQNIYKFTNAYDSKGYQTEDFTYDWSNNQWVMSNNSYKMAYTYNADNNITEFVEQSWDDMSSSFKNSWRYTTTFNAAGKIQQETYYDWTGSAWEASSRDNFIYAAPSGPFTEIISEEYVNGSFVNESRYTDITWHNFEGFQPLTYTSHEWNGASWDMTERSSTVYDQNGGSVETIEDYSSGNWAMSFRWTESIDNQGNFTGSKGESWTGSSWMLEYQEEEVLTYNANFDVTQRVFRNTFNIMGTLEDDRKEEYGNFQYITSAPANVAELPVSIFPNPAQNSIFVSGTISDAVTVTITDLTGRLVLTQKLQLASGEINIANLTSGTYLMRISNAEGSKTAKIVKL